MKDKSIPFGTPMIRALLDGRKSMTRRIFKPQPEMIGERDCRVMGQQGSVDYLMREIAPRYWMRFKVGDRVYVKEASTRNGGLLQFVADHETTLHPWPAHWTRDPQRSTYLPRRASRLTLHVTAVKVERLQEISDEDALAEGVDTSEAIPGQDFDIDGNWWPGGPKRLFQRLWDSIHGPGAWVQNPWVAAISFRAVRANIDAPPPEKP